MTTTSEIPTQKKALRAHMVELRRRACMAGGEAAAHRLAELAEELAPRPGLVVAGYWPMGDELDSRPLMGRLQDLGCVLALPAVSAKGQPLDFRAFAFGDDLESGLHGTIHPLASAAAVSPHLILLPLLAFDRQCFRLGYGGGYYDRTLETLRAKGHVRTMGLGFAVQEVSAVPHDSHDQRLDGIVTENGLIMPETK